MFNVKSFNTGHYSFCADSCQALLSNFVWIKVIRYFTN